MRKARGSVVKAALLLMLACFAAVLPRTAAGADMAGVRFADHVTVGRESLVLNGVGARRATIFKITVYAAALYVRVRTTSGDEVLRADKPKYFHAVMKRDVSRDDTAPAFRQGIERSAGATAGAIRDEIAAFERWMPSMRSGDQLMVSFTPGSGVVVTSTAKAEPFRASVDFGTALFGMWLGPKSSDADLRQGLLKGSE